MKRKHFLSFLLAVLIFLSLLPADQAAAGWADDFQSFVLEQGYLSTGLRFSDGAYNKPLFSLYDMDKDGRPELLICNGILPPTESMIYVFTCGSGQIRHAGSSSAGCGQPYRDETSTYPGILANCGEGTSHRQIYYELVNGLLVEIPVRIVAMNQDLSTSSVQLTDDQNLYSYAVSCHNDSYRYSLKFYKLEEIRAMGWDAFVRATAGTPDTATIGTVISMSVQQQFAANIFLSNFSEQHAFEKRSFDVNNRNLDDLVNFAYLYCKINRRSALSTAEVNGSYYYTLSLEEANRVWDRHFGFTLSEAEAAQYPLSPYVYETINTKYSSFYASGSFYFPAADGEAYNRLTIVRQMEKLGDGNYRLLFDIYKLDINEYRYYNGVDSGFYYLTDAAAREDSRLTWQESGAAIVRPYVNNGHPTYQLIRYGVGDEAWKQVAGDRATKRIYTEAAVYSDSDPRDARGGKLQLGGNYEEFLWGSFLFETPSMQLSGQSLSDRSSPSYNLAMLCGSLCIDSYNYKYLAQAYLDLGVDETAISFYSYPDSKYNRPNAKRAGSDFARDGDLAFSIASMQMPINGVETDILYITLRGTNNPITEGREDIVTAAEKYFYGYSAYNYVWEFEEDVFAGLADYQKLHPELGFRPMKILVTGHSLGGAAANLVAARLNHDEWYADAVTTDDIYCYTFGAIDSIFNVQAALKAIEKIKENGLNIDLSEAERLLQDNWEEYPITEKYENIINIYNLLDTFGPVTRGIGSLINTAACSGYGKFGIILLFSDDMNGQFPWNVIAPTHEIVGYVRAVKNGAPAFDPDFREKMS